MTDMAKERQALRRVSEAARSSDYALSGLEIDLATLKALIERVGQGVEVDAQRSEMGIWYASSDRLRHGAPALLLPPEAKGGAG